MPRHNLIKRKVTNNCDDNNTNQDTLNRNSDLEALIKSNVVRKNKNITQIDDIIIMKDVYENVDETKLDLLIKSSLVLMLTVRNIDQQAKFSMK